MLIEKVVGLTGFVIIHVFIASFSPAQGESSQMVNTKFTRPVNAMPMSTGERIWSELKKILEGNHAAEILTKMAECKLFPHMGLPEQPGRTMV